MVLGTDQQNRDVEWYLEHHKELEEKYLGRVVVISNKEVLGDFASEGEAVLKTLETLEMGTFIVQRVRKDNAPYVI